MGEPSYEKQFEEDLERAQALSLESLALEEFKNRRDRELRETALGNRNVSVTRASSMTEKDGPEKYLRQQPKPRPRPGTTGGAINMSLIAPPPSSSRKNSTANESPDLISFSSPPPPENNSMIEFCNSQNYNNNSNLSSFSTSPAVLSQPKVPFNFNNPQIQRPHLNLGMFQPSNSPRLQHPQMGVPAYGWNINTSYNLPTMSQGFPNSSVMSSSSSPIATSQGGLLSASVSGSEPLIGGNFMSPLVGGTSSGYSTPSGNVRSIGFAPPANQLQVPALPPKNQHRTPPPIAVPSSKSAAHRTVTKRNSHNLIDLAHSDQTTDKNSVRVSILQEFDPILSTYCDYGIPLRTKSPECSGDDTISICESVYDEYDPYDFITTGSGANSVSDPIYAAVIKSEAAPHSPVPPLPPRDRMTTLDRSRAKLRKGKLNLLENIVKIEDRTSEFKGTELYEFYTMVKNIRKKYKYNDPDTNMGLVMSPMVDYQYKENTSIKLVIYPDYEGSDLDKPIAFTCDVTTSLEHVTLQAVYECEAPSNINYTLKVWGSNEYLAPTTLLSDYEYVLNCLKLEDDVLLSLIPDSKIDKSFARTEQDDFRDKNINFEDVVPSDYLEHISYENLKILLETLESEIKKLEDQALEFENNKNSSKMPLLQPSKVTQSVKCVINFMNKLCTLDVIEAVDVLQNVCNNFITDRESASLSENISNSCNKIKTAVLNLVDMYCAAYRVNFKLGTPEIIYEDNLEVQDVLDPVMLRLCAIYRPEIEWKHDNYIIAVQIYHGKKPIGHPILTQPSVKTEQDSLWPSRIMFNQMIQIDDVSISSLARESRLVLVVYGRIEEPQENNDSSNAPNYKQEEIGWTSVQFFDYEGTMVQGGMLLSIWPKESSYMYGPAPAPATHPDPEHSMLGIEITELGSKISFPSVSPDLTSKVMRGDFSSLDIQTQQQLLDITEQDMLAKLPSEIREVLWDKRHYLYNIPEALPKVLLAAHSWESSCLPDLHGMLQKWTPLKPIQALELVLPTYPDIEVRKFAVKWFSQCPNDALIDYLPQLVVALKHETYENSTLAQFLLDQSLRSPRFAHYLFWLLSHNLPGNNPQNNSIHESLDLNDNFVIAEARYHRRSKLLLRALLAICGEALRNCFLSQQMLVKELNEVAENVQKVKESHRQTTLINAMQKLDTNLMDNNTSLPLSPTLKVAGIQVRSCYYFPSNTLPLKINFIATDKSIISAIYKVGDDLQQDMLTLQMVRIMEKLWLKKGLDLKIVSFACIPTGKKRGMIEMVSKAETLRKIQVEHGLTGSFKDKPIAEWLAKHNPSELEYERAVQNFTASCAGYCVATYILGICDRHNDNIMLKTSGHLFHIDFGKFLGDAQMFGNFKRDRAPFVLTSDMAYVINGGDRPSEKFHSFVDLCCQAFNIVRDNGNLFLYLLTLMVSSGMCGVTSDSVNYLRRALLPEMSNPEAAAYFARLIQSSLKSWFTQFNFFLHNLAQLKFTGEHNENTLLSFVPKTYTKEMDGQIKEVQVVKYQKRYDPDKYYVYVLRVYREDTSNMAMEIQRTYKEFCELHQKLCIYFPLAKLHSLSNGLHVGRSNIKQVAEKRYHEVSLFVSSLFKCAKEIAHSDLVYTFFHPLLRDQQNHENYYRKSKDRLSFRNDIGMLKGQLKLSLHFSKNVFRVMVYHARGLGVLPNGQEPSTYVKVYLEPDNYKSTKRKTKVVKRNCHPSFMEMLEYRMTLDIIQSRFLKATVWNYDALQENEFLGGIELDLSQFDLTKEITEWYPLVNLSRKPA